jgi:hypothetical protein
MAHKHLHNHQVVSQLLLVMAPLQVSKGRGGVLTHVYRNYVMLYTTRGCRGSEQSVCVRGQGSVLAYTCLSVYNFTDARCCAATLRHISTR